MRALMNFLRDSLAGPIHTLASSWMKATMLLLLGSVLITQPAKAAEKTSFKVAWSIYVGWMPWDYADKSGIRKKWADKYGIKIELTQVNDYVESINQYTAGAFDACVMTNMDMLTIPAAGGVIPRH
jgi:NitT/TauT family transport system substrate-binding protein